MFFKSNCSYCDLLQSLLIDIGVPNDRLHKVNIQEPKNAFQECAEELASISSSFTFPQLFVKGKYIGGYADIKKLYQFNMDFLQNVFKEVHIDIVSDF
jgi:glutaredoxin